MGIVRQCAVIGTTAIFLVAFSYLPIASGKSVLGIVELGVPTMCLALACLAVRFRELRTLLAACSVAAVWITQQSFVVQPELMITFCLFLLLELVFIATLHEPAIDWQIVGLWAGWLLLSRVVLFGAAKYWNADMAGLLPFANPAVIVASAALLALIAIAISKRDPISFGLLWSGFTLSVGAFHAPKISLYLLASALVLGVSFIERSYWIAYYDELTGIRGRRALNEAFETLESGYCLAVVDVDHFKSFNDTFGHDTGDQVLRKVAGQLARVGGGGEAYRCGGEEFVIVFRNRSAADAMKSAEKVREAIEQDVFHVRGADRSNREREERRRFHKSNPRRKHEAVTVTVSIGLAEAPEGFSAQQVYKAADRALYRAKDSGRNRVELARRAASPSTVAAQV